MTAAEALAKYARDKNLNLREANLRWANLRGAGLTGADLTRADLYGADLSGADLSGSDLTRADLYGADLSGAGLTGANLTEANLTEANLTGANLTGANLTEANLTGANLTGANLSWRAEWSILPAGILRVYKRVSYNFGSQVIELEIPADARRVNSPTGRKCRAERAIVVECKTTYPSYSKYDPSFTYELGAVVEPREAFNDDWRIECASGIHFFLTREEAEAYI